MTGNQETIRRTSNFYPSFGLLPSRAHRALGTLYDFCRESDDRVDADLPVPKRRKLLREWEKELKRCYHGEPEHPVAKALQSLLQEFPIPQKYFEDLLRGMAMDLDRRRYPTFKALALYFYRVAGVVGLMCLKVFGVSETAGRAYALHLATALQLTNIIRDVRTDLIMERIYFPLEDFKRLGYSLEDYRQGVWNKEAEKFFSFQIQRAKGYFESARHRLPVQERKKIRAARVMGIIYEKILNKIAKDPQRIFRGKVSISKWAKFTAVLQAVFTSR